MKIAITYKDGEVFQHFGKTEEFKIYEILNDKIIYSEVLSLSNNKYETFAEFLSSLGVTKVICGGIGGGAKTSLRASNIELYAGVSGNADVQAEQFSLGKLQYNPSTECDSHGHDHKHHHEDK